MSTIQELLVRGEHLLKSSGNEYAKYERKVLLEEVTGLKYMYMLMNGEETVSQEVEERYMQLLEKRCSHYPLQYLLGEAHFMDFTFYVNEHVLIPRSDTEVLVETVTEQLKRYGQEEGNLLDLCCGSGCIGISLKLYHKKLDLTLSDVSEKALEVAVKNLDKYDIEAETNCGNLFEGISQKQDIIVSNPPYIQREIISTLMPEVKDYEPMLALDGGMDGLDYYRKIIEKAPEYLKENGWLFFEIGYDQGDAVSAMLEQKGFFDVQVRKDYSGLNRVVYGRK